MRFTGLNGNELRVELRPGETLYFDLRQLRSPTFSQDVTPHFREAWFPRLLAGKLWQPHLTAGPDGDEVLLSGPEAFGEFHVVTLAAGESMFVRLPQLVAYAFDDGGRFRSSLNPFDPVRWLVGAVSSVLVQGPASLVFYGRSVEDVEAEAGERCFADQIHACTATAPFTVSGYLPQGRGPWADLINTVSTTVNVSFMGPVRLVKTTTRSERTSRLAAIGRILLCGVLLGWLIERVLTAESLLHPWGVPLQAPARSSPAS